jgi:hypothetical protein
MNFTPWQIDKLRRGLHAYRLVKAANGRLPSWRVVHRNLLLAEKTAHSFPDGGDPHFKEEALRRFAVGESALQPDKLEDVWLFLIEKGVIGRDEIEAADGSGLVNDALRAHDLMASAASSAKERIARLEPVYAASRTDMYRKTEKVELRIVDRLSDTLISVEETTHVLDESRRNAAVAGTYVRRGYGFAMSEHPTLHVFLQGASPEDRPHYTEVTALRASEDECLLHLLRTGLVVFPPVASTSNATLALASAMGVLRFEAAKQLVVARKRKTREAERL